MEPAELAAIQDAWQERVKREDRRMALVTTLLANVHREDGTPAYHPADFFPSLEDTRPELTEDQVEAKIAATFGAMKG